MSGGGLVIRLNYDEEDLSVEIRGKKVIAVKDDEVDVKDAFKDLEVEEMQMVERIYMGIKRF